MYILKRFKKKKSSCRKKTKKTILAEPQPPNAANPMPGATGSG